MEWGDCLKVEGCLDVDEGLRFRKGGWQLDGRVNSWMSELNEGKRFVAEMSDGYDSRETLKKRRGLCRCVLLEI